MTSEPRAKICLSLQASTLRAIDALAAHLHLSRSAAADAALRYVTSFEVEPAAPVEVRVTGGLDSTQELTDA